MQNVEQLLKEREELFSKTFSNQKGSRIPIIVTDITWKYFYAGYTPRECLGNTELTKTVFRKYYNDIYMDGVRGTHYGRMVSENTLDTVGGGTYTYGKDGVPQTRPGATTIMEAAEYSELIEDPYKFMLEKVLPRRYKLMKITNDKKYSDLCKVMDDSNMAFKNIIEEAKIPEEEFGIYSVKSASFYNPVDLILDYLRDFDVIMRDIKRIPEKVRDAGLALIDFTVDCIGNAPKGPAKVLSCPMHLPPFIGRKDFEKVYWPSWEKLAKLYTSKGYKAQCAFEKSFAHIFEVIADLPEGIIAYIEDDTPWDTKKALPNMPVIGGMPNELLYYESKEKCIDYVKMLLDKMAPYGGYIFSPNLAMMVLTDGKAENLQAVNEYVRDYGKC